MAAPDEILLRLARAGDRDAAGRLIAENTGLIWSVARRYFGRGAEPDDLYQLGCVGFLKAVQGFDEGFGTRFSTYAVPKIAGEIRRFLRDDGAVKVSRTLKERANQVKTARTALEQRLGREPTLSELSEKTGLTAEDIASCETAVTAPESLQQESGEDGRSLERTLRSPEDEERLIEHVDLRRAIGELQERESMVILLRFYRGMTQDAAARVMGVSQVQVSRLERRALTALREKLKTG
ncbi:MAG: sigma-70 family RNA polymerase sigma factor [Oscillospiraceae bacterium]|nr:sigma-70 family RNA polymerase sigma factor [Oscillospiraceae bacterium]